MNSLQTEVNKLTLSQAKAQEIRQKLDEELLPAIRDVERELAAIETTKSNWRDTVANPIAVERLEDDRKRLLNRRAILTDARDRAQQELRLAVAQVEVDQLAELRAEYQRIGDSRTQAARDIVAAAEMVAAKISEVERMRVQMLGVMRQTQRFFVGRATGLEERRRSDRFEMQIRLLNSTSVQTAIECVIAAGTPAHVWESEVRGAIGRVPDAVVAVGGQCRGGLIVIDECMKRLVDDAKRG